MTRPIVVHPGFHKTGTTSLQDALAANRAVLAPHATVMLRADMPAICRSAKVYSETRDALDLGVFSYELACLLSEQALDDPRPLLLSCEDLCGLMPGRRGATGYGAAAALAAAIVRVTAEVAGQGARPAFYISTRRKGWLQSLYWQLLLRDRLRLDQVEFKRLYRAAADLDAAARAVTRAVAPSAVTVMALEDMTGPLGPLDPVLDLLGIPPDLRARLTPPEQRNSKGGPKLRARMLDVNRGDLPDRQALIRRRRMLRQWQDRYGRGNGPS